MKPILVFDYDGTIHNTMAIYEPAFRQCYAWLTETGYAPEQEIPTKRIAGWLGMNSKEMWNQFMPELSEHMKEQASAYIGNCMTEQIQRHQAVWYPGAEEALDELKSRGYTMVVLSNCKTEYRKANWKEFCMGRWFLDFYDCESFGFAPKTEIIKELRKRLNSAFIVIGDRRSDMDCAGVYQSPFIGCRYGFGGKGELEGADLFADSVCELPKLITGIAC